MKTTKAIFRIATFTLGSTGRICTSSVVPLLLLRLIAALVLMLAGRITAQTFTTLHGFTPIADPYYTNSDGGWPESGLILSGNTLYGTAFLGGTHGRGTVFAVNIDGAGFTNLHSCATGSGSDGYGPVAGLILSGCTLYGTTESGGISGNGTVFAVNIDGTGFTNLHSFTGSTRNSSGFYTNSDGAIPNELILSGNTLYGTAKGGGIAGDGTVFAIKTNGVGFRTLYSFATISTNSAGAWTNSDGAIPCAGLILSGNTLFGTAVEGGSGGSGTVLKLNTDGSVFRNLHNFTKGSDGAYPAAGLMLSGNTLYGTVRAGRPWAWGYAPSIVLTTKCAR